MTRAMEAVAPMLNHQRKTIVRVEALVLMAAALLFLQFILGFCKRLWQNSIVSFVLKVCDKLMFPLIVYTLGTMQTSPIKNSVYPVWAVSLIIASGATGAIKQPNDLPTAEHFVSLYIEVLRHGFYFLMFSQLLSPSTPKFIWPTGHQQQYRLPSASSICTNYLFGLVIISKLIEGFGGYLFGVAHCVTVAEWMKRKENSDDHSDSKSINDYNYLVRYRFNFCNCCRKNLSTDEAPSNDNATTVNQIWGCFQNHDDGIPADHKNRLKDACLSFALFELLKRRYFGWTCTEASLRKTKDFVFKVLLPHPDDDYKWAFRIIETELGLCYDFLFTKYQLIYATGLWLPFWIVWFVFFLAKIILIIVIGVYALKNSLILETPSPIIEVHSAKTDYIIAVAFLCIILMVQLLQRAFYIASDWAKVSFTCTYVKRRSCAPIAFILAKVVGFICRINISVQCRNKIGQCSIISDRSVPTPLNKLRVPAVKVSNAVKKAIANSLVSTDGELTKGDGALRKYEMYDENYWTLKNHSQIEVMLIWHIATDYCDLALSGDGEERDVAVTLSRYYAYLITFVPELLPYHVGDIREFISTVRKEIETLPSRRSSERHSMMKMLKTATLAPWTPSKMFDIMKALEGTEKEDNPTTVFMKGVKLGKQLAGMPNGVQPWKMLAEFWAETIIYITPSHHTAKHHMEHLESGGEFLTKIWVLLSHAGILNLDRGKDQGPKPAQPQTA